MKPLLSVLAIVFVLGASLFFAGKNRGEHRPVAVMPETLVQEYDQKEMDRAIHTARQRVGEFISVMESNGAESYSVKVAVIDGPNTEHFWLSEVSYENGEFSGNIDNEPGVVKTVTAGQPWKVKKDDISDWMYIIAEKVHGGFTVDPLLPSMPKEQADAIRENFVR